MTKEESYKKKIAAMVAGKILTNANRLRQAGKISARLAFESACGAALCDDPFLLAVVEQFPGSRVRVDLGIDEETGELLPNVKALK